MGPRWRLALASAGVLVAAADTYVVVLALPNIMGGVGLGLDQLQQATPILSGFLVGYTVMLPLIGRLSDRYGRPPALVGCLLVFGAGSTVTATAQSLAGVVVGRVIQGVGGGGLVPVTLALVADLWPAERRGLPLGIVGGVQESGSLLGPLYGALIVAAAGWRAIFWINVPVALVLGLALRPRSRGVARRDPTGSVLLLTGVAAGVLALAAPAVIADSPTLGRLYSPLLAWGPPRLTTPLALAAVVALAAFVAWELRPAGGNRLVDLRRVPEVTRQGEAGGAVLLAAALAAVIVSFASADPSRQVVSTAAPVLLALGAAAAAGFALRQRRQDDPLIDFRALRPAPAWGALVTSAWLGAGLMAALVDIPVFARATAYPHSQLDAALVLVRFLVAVPVGAVAGGALCRLAGHRLVAGGGMALSAATFWMMGGWGQRSLLEPWRLGSVHLPVHGADPVLAACGLGFGLTVAPLNAAILNTVRAGLHGMATSLVVVSRTVGMLVGLSVLTGVGLHRFYLAEQRIGSPLRLCPRHPGSCPPYDRAVLAALLSELHTIFIGAAVCTAVAAVAAVVSLGPQPPGQPAPQSTRPASSSATDPALPSEPPSSTHLQ
ncbi:MAG TPA: MFS transporter [Acidimicrobiales bacterium]|nr:MFS transporter [Acidimicrobiales bacterium]